MKKSLMQDTVARPLPHNQWGLMNRQDGGYGRSCVRYSTLLEMWQDWDISFGDKGQDEHGEFIRVVRGAQPVRGA